MGADDERGKVFKSMTAGTPSKPFDAFLRCIQTDLDLWREQGHLTTGEMMAAVTYALAKRLLIDCNGNKKAVRDIFVDAVNTSLKLL